MLRRDHPEVADWLSHALEDEQVARLLAPHGLHAAIGYHCQQEGEKRLKALLVAAELIPPRTHNLLALLDLLRKAGLELADLELPCAELTPWASVSRYPGHGDLTADDARAALGHGDPGGNGSRAGGFGLDAGRGVWLGRFACGDRAGPFCPRRLALRARRPLRQKAASDAALAGPHP